MNRKTSNAWCFPSDKPSISLNSCLNLASMSMPLVVAVAVLLFIFFLCVHTDPQLLWPTQEGNGGSRLPTFTIPGPQNLLKNLQEGRFPAFARAWRELSKTSVLCCFVRGSVNNFTKTVSFLSLLHKNEAVWTGAKYLSWEFSFSCQ